MHRQASLLPPPPTPRGPVVRLSGRNISHRSGRLLRTPSCEFYLFLPHPAKLFVHPIFILLAFSVEAEHPPPLLPTQGLAAP